jgi:hypothetical protein
MANKIFYALLLTAAMASGSTYAGLHGLTHHSRANCIGFNESISWHAGNAYWMWVVSRHRHVNGADHQLVADWSYTWRSAAYHTNEGKGGWSVEGHHWMKESEAGMPYQVAEENVDDCSIYDGWWG